MATAMPSQPNPAYEPYDREAVTSWIRQMPASFRDWLTTQFNEQVNYLRGVGDLVGMARYQGRLDTLEMILKIREEA